MPSRAAFRTLASAPSKIIVSAMKGKSSGRKAIPLHVAETFASALMAVWSCFCTEVEVSTVRPSLGWYFALSKGSSSSTSAVGMLLGKVMPKALRALRMPLSLLRAIRALRAMAAFLPSVLDAPSAVILVVSSLARSAMFGFH